MLTVRKKRPAPRSASKGLLRRARLLERRRSTRDEEGVYIAWGRHLAREAAESGVVIDHALVGPSLVETADGAAILASLRARSIGPHRATTRDLEAIVEGAGDQGILLIIRRPAASLKTVLSRHPTLLVVTHGIQDPGNLGSIVRTGLALGADALVTLEGCADPFGSRAVRAGMGAHFGLPILCTDTVDAMKRLEEADIRTVAATPGADRFPHEVDFRGPVALFLGNEGAGLPRTVIEAASQGVRIPMTAKVGSLNVHAAAAVLLYEVLRQRTPAPPHG